MENINLQSLAEQLQTAFGNIDFASIGEQLAREHAATQKMLADLVPDYTQFAKDLSTFEDLAGSFSGTNRLLEEFAAAQAFEPPTLYDPSYYVLPPPPPRFEVRPPRFDVLDEPEPLPKRTIVRPEVKRKPGFQRW